MIDFKNLRFNEIEIEEADKIIDELGFNDPDFDGEKEFYLIMAKIKKNNLMETLSKFINIEVINYINEQFKETKIENDSLLFEYITDAILVVAEKSENYKSIRNILNERDEYILIGALAVSLLPPAK